MTFQLELIETTDYSWKLSDATCERGLAGVAAARALLRKPGAAELTLVAGELSEPNIDASATSAQDHQAA